MDCYSETNSDLAGRQTRGHHCGHTIPRVPIAVSVKRTDMVTVSTTVVPHTLFGEHVNKPAWQLTLREDSPDSIRNANLETLKLNLAGVPAGDEVCSPAPPAAPELAVLYRPARKSRVVKSGMNAPELIRCTSYDCKTN